MHVFLLRGYAAAKRDIALRLANNRSSRVVSLSSDVSLEEASSTRRLEFARLVLSKSRVIVVSDLLATKDECDEFIEFATNHGYQVTSLVVEELIDGQSQPAIQPFETQLRPSGRGRPQTESPLNTDYTNKEKR